LFAVFLLGAMAPVWAHDPGLSTATIRLGTNHIEATLGFSIVDAGDIVELDRNHDGSITKEELTEAAVELKEIAPGSLDVTFDGTAAKATNAVCSFDENNNATVELIIPARTFSVLVVRSKWLALLQPGHRQFVSLQNPSGVVLAERLLSANSDSITIQMDAPTGAADAASHPVQTGAGNSFLEFLWMGIIHIWKGYDHLLFLFGLLVVTKNFSSSVKIITCFTIAHSITLAVATLSRLQIPSRIVEPLIAASIVYVGVENLFRGGEPKGRWLLTFAFGLIHGFGFASVLRELGVGVNGIPIAVPLVSFNLGVELGQIAIAAVVLPLIWQLRQKPLFVSRWVPACSVLTALLGGYWFVQRVWF
jgi:hydrogenase/urease accessory protein HupE